MVEEAERTSRLVSFEPERKPAEVDREWIEVHPVHAVGDRLADGVAEHRRVWLVLAARQARQLAPDAPGRRKQEVTAPASGVAHCEVKQCPSLSFDARRRSQGLLDDRVKRAADQLLYQHRGCVVGAGGLPFASGSQVELRLSPVRPEGRLFVEQALVYGTKLLDIEVAVIDAPVAGLRGRARKSFDRVLECRVSELRPLKVGAHSLIEDTAAKRGQPEVHVPGSQEVECNAVGAPEVFVTLVAAVAAEPFAQPRDGVVVGVDRSASWGGVGREEQVAFLRNKQKEQPVNHAEELAVVPGLVEITRGELRAQCLVFRMVEESLPQCADRLLDTEAEVAQRTRPPNERGLVPFLQEATRRVCRALRQAGPVRHHPEEREVGEDTALHHSFEVELQIGGTREAGVVTQDT